MRRALWQLSIAFGACFVACSNGGSPEGSADGGLVQGDEAGDEAGVDAFLGESGPTPWPDAGPTWNPDASIGHPCTLPGSIQFTSTGTVVVPGGSSSSADLSFLHLPAGFCAHYFGTVGNARQLRFAPSGELFVASPTTGTTGGGSGGQSAILVLPDDNHDGVADAPVTFLGGLPSTQGILFVSGYFYYQDGTKIMRLPYKAGDRMPSGMAAQVADIAVYTSSVHWPKTLDLADDGTIYVGNGGDATEQCDPAHPFHGGVLSIDPVPGGPNPGGVQVAKGLRNPIAIRCARGHDHCFALELAKDYSAAEGGREKMIPIRAGDDWGFPCCATTNVAYATSPPGTDCSKVTPDTNSFVIGDTPFGVDFEPGSWSGTWAGRAYVVTHGSYGTWAGARVIAIPMDPSTGLPQQSSDVNGSNTGMVDFATGWDDHTNAHGRPAAVAFSGDGRLFIANDNNGVIFWIAPI
jgi:glucose/arabinose dehydrogenase